jgi:outer membrane biosynthesis protein TonB
MAKVYLAHDPEFDRQVAIKVLPAQLAQDSQFLERFRREARTIAALEHPAIVPVYDFGQHEGQPYLVMRYMPGGSLDQRLTGGRTLTLDQTADLLDRLAPALDEVHLRGIVHRDLKPGNILFDANNKPYLSDFGIVKLSEGDAATLTALGGTLGTPAYMSPEQARGDTNLDGRSDIYSLGVILYQLLSGELPYKADTPVGLAVAHVSEPVPDIRAAARGLPANTQTLIAAALAKDPANRPQTAQALAQNVRRLAAGQPLLLATGATVIEPYAGTAAGGGTTAIDAPPAVSAPPVDSPPTGEPPAQGRRPLRAALGFIGFALLLGVVGYFALSMRGFSFTGAPAAEPTASIIATDTPAAAAQSQPPETETPAPAATATGQPAPETPPPTAVPPIGTSSTYVEYILDASGSMVDLLEGKPKLAIAKDVLMARLNLLPPDINVGLRVYGHRLPWQDGEEASCDDIELVVPIGPASAAQINQFLPDMQAQGMTPMTESIRQAAADFTFTPDRNNLIVLLSDGIETCDEDPAEAVKILQELGIDFTIHVIGLAVDEEARQQLQALADVAGGVYHDADSEEDLNDALNQVNEDVVEVAMASASASQSGTSTAAAAEIAGDLSTPQPEATETIPLPTATLVPPTATQPPATAAPTAAPTETPAPPTAVPTNTAVPASETPLPTDTAEPAKTIVNASFEGRVSASSSYSGFPAGLALDGSTGTSWFSAGSVVDGNQSTFQWTGPQDQLITTVSILSNANNSEPSFRTGFGFETVHMQVLDTAGQVVYEERASLSGTPDPNVSFNPGVMGSTILLTFTGHESPDCGGFSELQVFVER